MDQKAVPANGPGRTVQALQSAIAAGAFDGRTLDEGLLLELHRRICADLRAADRNDWRALMDIWRRRFEETLP